MRQTIERWTKTRRTNDPPAAGSRPGAVRAAVVAALVAAGGATALAGDSKTLQGASAPNYPRSDDSIPPYPAPDGWGDYNPHATVYDTNWFFTADRGDENTIWFYVFGASIYGTAHVSNDDSTSVERLTKCAWGEDRIGFTVPDSEEGDVTIHLVNLIQMDASWHLDPKGDHFLNLDATARDMTGAAHPLKVLRATNCPTQVTTKSVTAFRLGASDTDSSTSGDDGSSSTESESASGGLDVSDETSRTTASGSGDTGTVTYCATIARSVNSRTCSVRISSTESATLATRSMEEDHETYIDVPRFDTINIVGAAYTVVPVTGAPGTPGGDTGSGVGSPGGDTSGGPTTPSGGGGSTTTTPSGTSPGEEPEEDATQDPAAPPGDDPPPPPSGDTFPGGATTPSGGDSSGGTAPEEDGGGTTLGGGTSTSGDGTAPSGSGTAPAPGTGTGTPDAGGSLPSGGSDPLADRPPGGSTGTASGGPY